MQDGCAIDTRLLSLRGAEHISCSSSPSAISLPVSEPSGPGSPIVFVFLYLRHIA
jgi:hypothetical protein